MGRTSLVCLLLLMPLAGGCARSVRPAYPQDLAPGTATPPTGKCCRLGDLESHNLLLISSSSIQKTNPRTTLGVQSC